MDRHYGQVRSGPANRTAEFVDKLNSVYNLKLHVPDLGLSPTKRREALASAEARLAEQIHSRIRYLASRSPEVLREIELQFTESASRICTFWGPKPRAAPNHLPVTRSLRRASTDEERRQLLESLRGILETWRPGHIKQLHPGRVEIYDPRTAALDFTRPTRVRGNDQQAQVPGHHKRPSDDMGPEPVADPATVWSPSCKKAKSVLDDVPVRLTVPSPPRPESHKRPSFSANRSFEEFNRSITTAPHLPSHHSFGGVPTAATHSFFSHHEHILNYESASTSVISHQPAVFSFPPPGSDGSQETIPNDDRQEYENASLLVSEAFYTRQSPTDQVWAEPEAVVENGPPWAFHTLQASPSMDGALVNLASDAVVQGRAEAGDEPYTRDESPDNFHIPWRDDDEGVLPILGGPPSLKSRYRDSWPKLPKFLINAPLPIIWELTRAALHCGVRLDTLHMQYDPSWHDLTKFRNALKTHRDFKDKILPSRCDDKAWTAAFLACQYRGLSVSLVMEANYNNGKSGPFYTLKLHPLKLELIHRLARRFGADRFLEVIFPSPTANTKPSGLKKSGATDELIRLISQSEHILLGRIWRSFYTKAAKKTEKVEILIRTETKTLPQERVYLFAVDGNDFEPCALGAVPPKEEATDIRRRTKTKFEDFLEWAIAPSQNGGQTTMKLFARLPLSLSRTTPAIVLEKHQIRVFGHDLKSPTGIVMNDGIGRMSSKMGKIISECLGLDVSEIPSGYQGRIGPYKGFWVIDSFDDGEIWIEGYPSQCKWKCNLEDPDHRTFEVREASRRLTPGALNEQFIPVLEDRADDPQRMRGAIAGLLIATVEKTLEEQTRAAHDPAALYAWAHRSIPVIRRDKIASRCIPFLGNLPNSDEEALKFLLDAGFDKNSTLVRWLTERLSRQRCDSLKAKMKITVDRSTYAFMVIDFSGVLEEGEVHLGFSRESTCDTRTPSGISSSYLHGHDVLVARAPAHLPSDVQKVKAVFRVELSHLQDVVVFSSKGNEPLADLLSGGDYDGDKAWVCWDPDIVDNFTNAPVPEKPNLFKTHDRDMKGYLAKDNQTFKNILSRCRNNRAMAATEFIMAGIHSNMQPHLLGQCTNYKEKVCYKTGSVSNEVAIILSTLVGHLVDQAKQGIIFTNADFTRLKSELIRVPLDYDDEPAYKRDRLSGSASHILDWLKFKVARPEIERRLTEFLEAISGGKQANSRDKDLEYHFDELEKMAKSSESYQVLRKSLSADLHAVSNLWSNSSASYPEKVDAAHRKWLDVRPSDKALEDKALAARLLGVTQDEPDAVSYWGLLKASVTHKGFGWREDFVLRVAGAHLAAIKASRRSAATGRPPVSVVHGMYVAHRPDNRMVKALTAGDEDGGGYAESVVDALDARDFDGYDDMMMDDDD